MCDGYNLSKCRLILLFSFYLHATVTARWRCPFPALANKASNLCRWINNENKQLQHLEKLILSQLWSPLDVVQMLMLITEWAHALSEAADERYMDRKVRICLRWPKLNLMWDAGVSSVVMSLCRDRWAVLHIFKVTQTLLVLPVTPVLFVVHRRLNKLHNLEPGPWPCVLCDLPRRSVCVMQELTYAVHSLEARITTMQPQRS